MTIEFVNIRDARMNLSELVDNAAAGREVVITRAGKPVARLVSLAAAGHRRKLGALRGKVRVPDDYNAPLPTKSLAEFVRR